jgi:hypothetical protein
MSYLDQVFGWAAQQQAQGEDGSLTVTLSSELQISYQGQLQGQTMLYNQAMMPLNIPSQWWSFQAGGLASTPQPGVLTYYPPVRAQEPLGPGGRILVPPYFRGSMSLSYSDAHGEPHSADVSIELLAPLGVEFISLPGAPQAPPPKLEVPGVIEPFVQGQYQLGVFPSQGAPLGLGTTYVSGQTGAGGYNNPLPNEDPVPQGTLLVICGQDAVPGLVFNSTLELVALIALTTVHLSG